MLNRIGAYPAMLATVVLTFLFFSQVVWSIWSDYQNTIETEYENLSIRVRLTEAQLSGSFRSLDLLLRELGELRLKDIKEPKSRVRDELASSLGLIPEVSGLFTTNASGIVDVNTQADLEGYNSVQREYFTHHAVSKAADSGLFVSKPFKGASGRQVFTVSRAMRGQNGQFMGVIVARLEIDTFAEVFRPLVPSETGSLTLFFIDGDVLFRWPNPERFIGRNFSKGSIFSEHIASGATETRHRNVATIDGVERLAVFRRLRPDNLTVGVSSDFNVVTARWRNNAMQRLTSLALISAIMALAFLLIQRRQREIEREQKFSQRIIETNPVGITIYDRDGQCLAANQAMVQHTGGTMESVTAQNYHEIASWKKSGIYELALKTQRTGESTNKVIHVTTSFGKDVWLSLTFSALETDGRLMLTTYDLSDLKQAQQLHLETEERFAMLFANSMDGILQTEPDGRILAANLAACAMLGYSEETLCQLNSYQMVFDSSDPRLHAFLEERAKTGRARGEVLLIRGNGERFQGEVSSVLYANTEGKSLSNFLIRDITERKLQEEKTRELLIENETILNNALVGIAYLKQRRIVSCNRRLEEIFRYQHGELVGESIERLYDSRETFESVGAQGYATVAQGKNFNTELKLRHKDGSVFWGALSGRAVDPEHPQDGSIWIYADISELKQADLALRQSEAKFSTAFSSCPIAASIATASDGRFIEANSNYERDFGWTNADLIGRTAVEVGIWPDQATRDAWVAALHRDGRLIDYETIWLHKNGMKRNVSLSAELTELDGKTCILAYCTDITARKQAEEKINELAFFDQLTGLPNRTLLLDRLKQTMAASSRSGSYGALLFIDLDNFKTLNDTLGHDIGDLLLKQVAQRLTQCVREGDTVARLGGDEFVALLAGLSTVEGDAAAGIESVAEKILTALNQTYQLAQVSHQSTASIGVTVFNDDRVTTDDLMKQADLAMYKSKETGRNAWRFFDPKMESAIKERAALEEDLRRALKEKQFLLHYQVQVVGKGRVTGAEALVRWQHPQRGMISPAAFVPFAEETGLILPLGHWVLEAACIQLASWATRPELAHLTVAVNVSAHQFRRPDFVDQVLAVLKNTGANPHRLKLELTESLLVSNVEDVIGKMFALKAKGVGFSLDDFGTGYSSLSYLKRLPLDQLKIDMSFVRDVLSDPNDAAIAKTIVALAQSLGLGVIAEGVETEAQLDFLATSGCYAYQGYFFSRPLPLREFEEFVQRISYASEEG